MAIPSFDLGFTIPPLILFPRFKDRRRRKIKKRKGITPFRKTAYRPTIAAIAYKITAPKIPRAYELGAAGIMRRPIIKKKKVKKKRKKKK